MARGESHRGVYEIPVESVQLLERYVSEIDQTFKQAATALAAQSNVVPLWASASECNRPPAA